MSKMKVAPLVFSLPSDEIREEPKEVPGANQGTSVSLVTKARIWLGLALIRVAGWFR